MEKETVCLPQVAASRSKCCRTASGELDRTETFEPCEEYWKTLVARLVDNATTANRITSRRRQEASLLAVNGCPRNVMDDFRTSCSLDYIVPDNSLCNCLEIFVTKVLRRSWASIGCPTAH